MTQTVRLTFDYDASPEAVWRVATDYAAFAEAVRGLLSFEGLPEGRVRQGQVIDTRFRLFGLLPPQDYRMRLVEVDDTRRTFLSEEEGAGVRRWTHRLTVDPTPDGARLTDEIEIDAGPMTPLYTAWARLLYRRRHPVRQRLLSQPVQA